MRPEGDVDGPLEQEGGVKVAGEEAGVDQLDEGIPVQRGLH